jgi:fructosamine-3-kinase
MLTPFLQAEVEKHLRQKIIAISPLSAANTVQIYRLVLDNKTACVAKFAQKGMDIEAWMLKFLKEKSKLPVPNVYYSNEHVIIMDFVDTNHDINDQSQRHAAELLGDLHKIRGESYGLERDTMMGGLHQPNPRSQDWVNFYIEQRLLYMANESLREGKIDKKMMQQIEKLAKKLPGYIGTPAGPALIHGDVWRGNVLAGGGRIVTFLDPAIYYADPEIELSFIRMLDTFGATFFSRYNEVNPIRPGFFEERADLYSLYYLLVYTRLFGISYARKVQKVLDKFS